MTAHGELLRGPDRAWVLWVAAVAYLVHMVEEVIYGWMNWSRYALGIRATWSEFVTVNAFVAVTGIACASIGWRAAWAALVFPAFMLTNAIGFHLLPSILTGTFSPGLITSIALFIPLGLYCYAAARGDGVLARRDVLVSGMLGVTLMCFPTVLQKTKGLPFVTGPAQTPQAR